MSSKIPVHSSSYNIKSTLNFVLFKQFLLFGQKTLQINTLVFSVKAGKNGLTLEKFLRITEYFGLGLVEQIFPFLFCPFIMLSLRPSGFTIPKTNSLKK